MFGKSAPFQNHIPQGKVWLEGVYCKNLVKIPARTSDKKWSWCRTLNHTKATMGIWFTSTSGCMFDLIGCKDSQRFTVNWTMLVYFGHWLQKMQHVFSDFPSDSSFCSLLLSLSLSVYFGPQEDGIVKHHSQISLIVCPHISMTNFHVGLPDYQRANLKSCQWHLLKPPHLANQKLRMALIKSHGLPWMGSTLFKERYSG